MRAPPLASHGRLRRLRVPTRTDTAARPIFRRLAPGNSQNEWARESCGLPESVTVQRRHGAGSCVGRFGHTGRWASWLSGADRSGQHAFVTDRDSVSVDLTPAPGSQQHRATARSPISLGRRSLRTAHGRPSTTAVAEAGNWGVSRRPRSSVTPHPSHHRCGPRNGIVVCASEHRFGRRQWGRARISMCAVSYLSSRNWYWIEA